MLSKEQYLQDKSKNIINMQMAYDFYLENSGVDKIKFSDFVEIFNKWITQPYYVNTKGEFKQPTVSKYWQYWDRKYEINDENDKI